MCTTCGCGGNHTHTHVDENGNVITHTHEHHDHDHGHEHGPERTVSVEEDILSRNNAVAAVNREQFRQKRILALNFVSSPGSGKTELLCATIRAAGEIVVIADGRIAERGTHDELIARHGLYEHIYEKQLGQQADNLRQ